jgi:4-hydroxybenzoate polyprenyltransferase
VRLGALMTALQFAIGALNDIVDAPADAGRVPPKPIPGGFVSIADARIVVALSVALGLALAPQIGLTMLFLGLLVLAIGFAYDLVFKGTAWSWVPFAAGIPILPIYGWFGATGTLPPFFATLTVMAVLAGAALAVANARADLDDDLDSGTRSVATMLGPDRSWWVDAGLMGAAISIGIVSLGGNAFRPEPWTLVAAGVGIVVSGLVLGRRQNRPARVRAWEAQAVGAAIAATGWIAAMTLPAA